MALLFYNIWFFHKKVEESKLSRGGCHFYCMRPFLSNAPYIIDDKMNPYQLPIEDVNLLSPRLMAQHGK